MELEQQLRAALAPRSPGPALRAGVMVRVRASKRGRGRYFLWGATLVIAAAAAMLASRVTNHPPAAEDPVAKVEFVQPGTTEAAPPEPVVEAGPELPATTTAVKPFTVSIQLQNEAKEDAAAAVETFYRSLLDKLRAVPGLVLVDPAQDGSSGADYTLRVLGTGPHEGGSFGLGIYQDSRKPDGAVIVQRAIEGGGEISPACAGRLPCSDPAGLVDVMIDWLRTSVLPEDVAYTEQMRAQLQDPSLDAELRFRALQALRRTSQARKPGSSMDSSMDLALIRSAAGLAANVRQPQLRAEIWRMVRGARDPELASPLLASLRTDDSDQVRIEALATLRADFHDDPRYRSALEKMALRDSSALMQALAQRELGGDAVAWKRHVVSSMLDTSLPPAQRIAAFEYQMYGIAPGSLSSTSQGDPKFLDDEVIAALASALPETSGLPQMKAVRHSLASNLLATGKPAALAAALDITNAEDDQAARSQLVKDLAQASLNPSTREALERAGAADADPRRRMLATEILQSAKTLATPRPLTTPDIALVLGKVKQVTDPQIRANVLRALAQAVGTSGVRESLEKFSRDDPDPELRQMAAEVLAAASGAAR